MNLFRRMSLDSVMGKKSPIKKTTKAEKAVVVKKTKTAKKINVLSVAVDIKKEVPEENCFRVFEGSVLRSLSDLCEALPEMTDEQFDHHTKRDGNDFARWIEDVLQEKDLAKKIARLKTKRGILSAIKKVSR